MKKDLLSMLDVKDSLFEILELSKKLKHSAIKPLSDKILGMIFEKPSTRTRVSFEVAAHNLGAHALYFSSKDLQIGRGETISDTAKVFSRYVDGVIYRANKHETMVEFAKNCTVPVINALDDLEHPCQVIADLLTIFEKKNTFELKLAYVGDGNNVCNSLLLGCSITGIEMVVACPKGYEPNKEILLVAEKIANITPKIITEPKDAVKDADVIYTDVWVSMGMESEEETRKKVFMKYQVNTELFKHAKNDCIFMHCLPAHRGLEVTDEIIDGVNSVVFDQAENRLHAQKAILTKFIGIL